MYLTRTWIFPILRLVLIGVIAVGLVKLAFFPGTAQTSFSA